MVFITIPLLIAGGTALLASGALAWEKYFDDPETTIAPLTGDVYVEKSGFDMTSLIPIAAIGAGVYFLSKNL